MTNQRDFLIRMRNERKFPICVYSLKVKMYVIVFLRFHLHICRAVIDEIWGPICKSYITSEYSHIKFNLECNENRERLRNVRISS